MRSIHPTHSTLPYSEQIARAAPAATAAATHHAVRSRWWHHVHAQAADTPKNDNPPRRLPTTVTDNATFHDAAAMPRRPATYDSAMFSAPSYAVIMALRCYLFDDSWLRRHAADWAHAGAIDAAIAPLARAAYHVCCCRFCCHARYFDARLHARAPLMRCWRPLRYAS